nr:hypothetical protein [Acidimicrobiia bacterium]
GLDDAAAGSLVLVRRAAPAPLAPGCVELHRVGDVTGTAGLFDAMAAARDIARCV